MPAEGYAPMSPVDRRISVIPSLVAGQRLSRDGKLVRIPPDPDGIYRSVVFPGLWLDPKALLDRDLNGLIATLDRGVASAQHAEFVARLESARTKK
jgi:hypothetical protein